MEHGNHKDKKMPKKMPMKKMMHSENEMGGMMQKLNVVKKRKGKKKRGSK